MPRLRLRLRAGGAPPSATMRLQRGTFPRISSKVLSARCSRSFSVRLLRRGVCRPGEAVGLLEQRGGHSLLDAASADQHPASCGTLVGKPWNGGNTCRCGAGSGRRQCPACRAASGTPSENTAQGACRFSVHSCPRHRNAHSCPRHRPQQTLRLAPQTRSTHSTRTDGSGCMGDSATPPQPPYDAAESLRVAPQLPPSAAPASVHSSSVVLSCTVATANCDDRLSGVRARLYHSACPRELAPAVPERPPALRFARAVPSATVTLCAELRNELTAAGNAFATNAPQQHSVRAPQGDAHFAPRRRTRNETTAHHRHQQLTKARAKQNARLWRNGVRYLPHLVADDDDVVVQGRRKIQNVREVALRAGAREEPRREAS